MKSNYHKLIIKGGIAFENKEYKNAIDDFTMAITYKPDYAYAYLMTTSTKQK